MDENKNIENTNNENIDNGNNAAGNRIDEKKTAGNSKLSYIIIGICCVAALVVGLFAGKTIADKSLCLSNFSFISNSLSGKQSHYKSCYAAYSYYDV